MLVVKLGGGAIKDGLAVVLVHGGSAETNELATRLGHPPKFITSPSGYESRYTDRVTLEIFAMVYAGKVNTRIVELLQQRGVNALGLTGLDGRLLEGPRKKVIKSVEGARQRIIRDDLSGKVERVNAGLLRLLLECGYTPVVTPPALSDEGEAINVDGDRAAAAIAVALQVERLVILSNVRGLLRDLADEGSLIPEVQREGREQAEAYAKGRMRVKLLAAREALDGGVREVILGDARRPQPISSALQGRGTVLR
ncbi:MAG: [LysW]-aminoadipate kinase [Deltaproteobacteria bacterium]|nr:[LysW]-aminoadipate kinase [Deltaproteobacteria bacterium]